MMRSMSKLDQPAHAETPRNFPQRNGLAWNVSAVAYGLVMYLVFNLLTYRRYTHRKFMSLDELTFQAILFVMWVGGSYAQAEWRRRRLLRQEEEDR